VYLLVRRVIKQTTIIIEAYHVSTTYKSLSNILLSRVTPYAEKILGIISVDFDVTGELLTIYSMSIKYLEKKKWVYNEVMHQLFIG